MTGGGLRLAIATNLSVPSVQSEGFIQTLMIERRPNDEPGVYVVPILFSKYFWHSGRAPKCIYYRQVVSS